jgi:hypothetical protein
MRPSAVLSFPESDNERKARRARVDIGALCWELRSAPVRVRVIDISASGCQFAGCDLESGAEIWLRLPTSEPLRARIVWASKGKAGCAFYKPLAEGAARRLAYRCGGSSSNDGCRFP